MKAPEHDLTAATIRCLAAEPDALQARVAKSIHNVVLQDHGSVWIAAHQKATKSYAEKITKLRGGRLKGSNEQGCQAVVRGCQAAWNSALEVSSSLHSSLSCVEDV